MKIKIFKSESIKELEADINVFLLDKTGIKVVDIREISSADYYILMIMYEGEK